MARLWALVLIAGLTACGESSPEAPSGPITTVRFVFSGSTTRRTDLPASAQSCLSGVGPTHMHPSWRSFVAIPLPAFPPDRYEITLDDVPTDTRVSFRINDQNSCDQNLTGAVTRNVFANGVELVQNATTPGAGDEPGFAFRVSAAGRVTQ